MEGIYAQGRVVELTPHHATRAARVRTLLSGASVEAVKGGESEEGGGKELHA